MIFPLTKALYLPRSFCIPQGDHILNDSRKLWVSFYTDKAYMVQILKNIYVSEHKGCHF